MAKTTSYRSVPAAIAAAQKLANRTGQPVKVLVSNPWERYAHVMYKPMAESIAARARTEGKRARVRRGPLEKNWTKRGAVAPTFEVQTYRKNPTQRNPYRYTSPPFKSYFDALDSLKWIKKLEGFRRGDVRDNRVVATFDLGGRRKNMPEGFEWIAGRKTKNPTRKRNRR